GRRSKTARLHHGPSLSAQCRNASRMSAIYGRTCPGTGAHYAARSNGSIRWPVAERARAETTRLSAAQHTLDCHRWWSEAVEPCAGLSGSAQADHVHVAYASLASSAGNVAR